MLSEEEVFEPWIGRDYVSGGILSKKMLIVGASHYCDNVYSDEDCDNCDYCKCSRTCICDCKCSQFTKRVIERYLSSDDMHAPWKNTYTKFVNSILRITRGETFHASLDDKFSFFHSIAFMNYLQVIEGADSDDKHPELYGQYAEKNLRNFKDVLHDLRPDVIVVWGENARSRIPADLGFGVAVGDKDNVDVMHYKFEDFSFDLFACAHPASRKFCTMKPSATEILRDLGVA